MNRLRLARIPFAAALLASASTVLAAPADPTASIEMSPTGWAVSLGSLVVVGAAIWVFRKVT
jgi:hypothetical protein